MNQNDGRYVGVLAALPIRLSDKLCTTLNVHVVPNDDKFILIGNDLFGGSHAKLTKVSSSDSHSFLVLQDKEGAQDVVQFIRNMERHEIPIPTLAYAKIGPEGPDEVKKLFRA